LILTIQAAISDHEIRTIQLVSFREVDEKLTSWFTDWFETFPPTSQFDHIHWYEQFISAVEKDLTPIDFGVMTHHQITVLKANIGGSLGITGITMNPLFCFDSAKFFATKFRGLTGMYQRFWINGSLQPTKTPEELQLLVDLTTNGGSHCESQKLKLHDAPCCSPFGVPFFSAALQGPKALSSESSMSAHRLNIYLE